MSFTFKVPIFSCNLLTDVLHDGFRITTIRDDLLPGRHTLSCVLLDKTLDPGGGKEFRFISVLYD